MSESDESFSTVPQPGIPGIEVFEVIVRARPAPDIPGDIKTANGAMLNSKNLNKFFKLNIDEKLYPRFVMMTTNGTLLGYNHPVNIKELRSQAALISMVWKEQAALLIQKAAAQQNATEGEPDDDLPGPVLQTLTIESDNANIIVKLLHKNLVMWLEGGVPPGWKCPLKFTPEEEGAARYPPDSPATKDAGVRLLDVQRRKADVVAKHLVDNFAASGFVLPDESAFP